MKKEVSDNTLLFWCWAINAVILFLWSAIVWDDSPGLAMSVLFGMGASPLLMLFMGPFLSLEMLLVKGAISGPEIDIEKENAIKNGIPRPKNARIVRPTFFQVLTAAFKPKPDRRRLKTQ
jgi:hypothetical protein